MWRRRIKLDPQAGQDAVLLQVESGIDEALDYASVQGYTCMGIGVGLPGTVDIQNRRLLFSYNLDWYDIAFDEIWQAKFGLPVYVENDANAAAVGEYYFGIARDVKNFIFIFLSSVGLGSGIFIGGRLLRGGNGFAGEIGHMTIDPHGEPCTCGRLGCWEAMVGPRAIAPRVSSQDLDPASPLYRLLDGKSETATFAKIAAAAQEDDPVALDVIHYVGETLAAGIANLVTIFNPEMVVLGGELSLVDGLLLPVVEQAVKSRVFKHPAEILQVKMSTHGVNACIKGAVTLVFDDILRQPSVK